MTGRERDGKARELAASRTLNPRPQAVVDEVFRASEFFDARDLVQVKYEMVRRVEADGAAVSATSDAFGFSRQSYYSAARALADEGLAGLVPSKPGPRGAHKLTDEVLEHLEALRQADPGLGATELAAAVQARFGGHSASSLGGASARPQGGRHAGPEKWLRARTTTRGTPARRRPGMSGCARRCCRAARVDGGWGMGCCARAGWSPG
jgi:transposase-like protein